MSFKLHHNYFDFHPFYPQSLIRWLGLLTIILDIPFATQRLIGTCLALLSLIHRSKSNLVSLRSTSDQTLGGKAELTNRSVSPSRDQFGWS